MLHRTFWRRTFWRRTFWRRTFWRPWLELAYVVAGLPLAVITFTFTVTGLALSVGLLPAFLLGIPTFVATVYLVHGLALTECGLARALLDDQLVARPVPRSTRRGFFRRPLSFVRSPEFWKEAAYSFAVLPMAAVGFAVVVGLWSASLAGLLLPLYVDKLAGDQAITWLHWGNGQEVAAGFGAGLVLLVVARVITAAFAAARLAMTRALLTPSESDRLRARVSTLTESRARVVDAADSERRRIERDLHDGAQQHLVAIAMNLGRAKEKMKSDPDGAAELIAAAHQDAKDSITALRNVVRGVHPAVLTDRGLDAALSALAARSPVPVRLDVDVPSRCSPTIEAVAYFVVSEALTNVAKHSGATRADVHVERSGDRLLVSVSDNGRGGAVAQPDSGLTGLRDRVRSVDGTFLLQSSPDGGTTVTVEVPCAS
jgi:signal transduction histidine kinase